MTSSASLTVVRVIGAALAAAAFALASGSANAQSCPRTDTATTQCRFMLSQPRDFTVVVQAELKTATPVSKALQITVDGRVCRQPRFSPFDHHTYLDGSCRLSLAAGLHTVVAELSAQARGAGGKPFPLTHDLIAPSVFEVMLAPSPRLAALPREDGELYPKPSRGHFHVWPFH